MPNPTLAKRTMSAVTIADYGPDAVLQLNPHFPKPHLRKDTEIIVNVKACAISAIDAQLRHGHFASLLPHLLDSHTHEASVRSHDAGGPHVMGYQISGVVIEIGDKVDKFKVGDQVVGLAPMSTGGGYAEYIVLDWYHLVAKPNNISHTLAAAVLSPGLQVQTAFDYILRCQTGESILVLDGASEAGLYAIQLAHEKGMQVMTTCRGREQELWLRKVIGSRIAHIINLPTTTPAPLTHRRSHSLIHHQHMDHLHEVVMQKTHGLGVNCILETMSPYWRRTAPIPTASMSTSTAMTAPATSALLDPYADATEGRSGDHSDVHPDVGGSRLVTNGRDASPPAPDERRGEEYRVARLVDLLSFGGRWCCVDDGVQIDPPDARMMFLRNASVGFMFEQAWGLSGAMVGEYLGILSSVLANVADETISAPFTEQYLRTCSLSEVREAHAEFERRARSVVHGWTRHGGVDEGKVSGRNTPNASGRNTPTGAGVGEGHGKWVGFVVVMGE